VSVDLQRHVVVSAPALYSGNSHFGFPLKYLLFLWHASLISEWRVSLNKCTDSAYLSCVLFILLYFLCVCAFLFFFLVCSSSSYHLSVLPFKLPPYGLNVYVPLSTVTWPVMCFTAHVLKMHVYKISRLCLHEHTYFP